MSELRVDPFTQEEVIVLTDSPTLTEITGMVRAATVDAARPPPRFDGCALCAGEGGPDIFRLEPSNVPPHCHPLHRNGVPWFTRVIPERQPLLRVEEAVGGRAVGAYDVKAGAGAHERIIESPAHGWSWAEATALEVAAYLHTVAERIRDLSRDARLVHFFPFRPSVRVESPEHASLHLLATTGTVAPPKLEADLRGAEAHLAYRGRCLTCDVLREESRRESAIASNAGARAFLPYFSPSPFEMWVVPERHVARLEASTADELVAVGVTVEAALRRMTAVLGSVPVTVRIFTAPRERVSEAPGDLGDYYHWRIEFIPRLPYRLGYYAGFVEGTRFAVNYAPPERAVELLRTQS